MLSDAKARKLKPDDKPVSDGTITGLYLVPGGSPGSGKWILRFCLPRPANVVKWAWKLSDYINQGGTDEGLRGAGRY